MTSTFDNLVAFGRQEGRHEMLKGVILSLNAAFPKWTHTKLAKHLNCEVSFVAEVLAGKSQP